MNGPLEPSYGFLNSQLSHDKGAILMTNYLDNYIAAGRLYMLTTDLDMTADTPLYYTSYTPSSSGITSYLMPIILNPTAGYITLYIYENTQYTGGTPAPSFNRNRRSNNNYVSTVLSGASGSVKGDLIMTRIYGTAAGALPSGASGGNSTPYASNVLYLKPDVKYLYELLPTESAIIGLEVEFIEI